MWREIQERTLPAGMVSVSTGSTRVVFGTKTMRAWKLRRFHSVTVLYDDKADLVGFQFHENGDGNRSFVRFGLGNACYVSCQGLLRTHGVKPGRYHIRKERDTFLTVNFGLRRE